MNPNQHPKPNNSYFPDLGPGVPGVPPRPNVSYSPGAIPSMPMHPAWSSLPLDMDTISKLQMSLLLYSRNLPGHFQQQMPGVIPRMDVPFRPAPDLYDRAHNPYYYTRGFPGPGFPGMLSPHHPMYAPPNPMASSAELELLRRNPYKFDAGNAPLLPSDRKKQKPAKQQELIILDTESDEEPPKPLAPPSRNNPNNHHSHPKESSFAKSQNPIIIPSSPNSNPIDHKPLPQSTRPNTKDTSMLLKKGPNNATPIPLPPLPPLNLIHLPKFQKPPIPLPQSLDATSIPSNSINLASASAPALSKKTTRGSTANKKVVTPIVNLESKTTQNNNNNNPVSSITTYVAMTNPPPISSNKPNTTTAQNSIKASNSVEPPTPLQNDKNATKIKLKKISKKNTYETIVLDTKEAKQTISSHNTKESTTKETKQKEQLTRESATPSYRDKVANLSSNREKRDIQRTKATTISTRYADAHGKIRTGATFQAYLPEFYLYNKSYYYPEKDEKKKNLMARLTWNQNEKKQLYEIIKRHYPEVLPEKIIKILNSIADIAHLRQSAEEDPTTLKIYIEAEEIGKEPTSNIDSAHSGRVTRQGSKRMN